MGMEETQTVTRACAGGRAWGVVAMGLLWVGVLLWPGLLGGKGGGLDGFHEMALAREAVRTGWVPAGDLWSYGETIFPVVHHEWGMGMILYWVWMSWGAWGLAGLMWVLVLGTMTACIAVARKRGAPWGLVLAGIVVASLMGMEGFAAVRAQYV